MAMSELSGGLWRIEPLWGELEELLGVHLPSSAEAWVRVVPRAMPRQAAHRKDRRCCIGTTRIIPGKVGGGDSLYMIRAGGSLGDLARGVALCGVDGACGRSGAQPTDGPGTR